MKLPVDRMPIVILSGEGEVGTYSSYMGAYTERAIRSRLSKERCNGDRWAKAYIYSHLTDDDQRVFVNLENDADMRVINVAAITHAS